MKRALCCLWLAICAGSSAADPGSTATACDTPASRVLEVGPGKPYLTPSAAAAVALDGDTIRIAASDYIGDVAIWTQKNLTICGHGGVAHLYANGKIAANKAIWVAAGNGMVVENIAFHDAKVIYRNGAGIRIEPNVSLTIRGCGFFDNETGILSGAGSNDIVIERSEFARNGFGDGQSHGLYIGRVNSLTVRQSFFHSTKIGHHLKSRAQRNLIEHSYFMDGTSGTASYQVEFPNGGEALLRGNLIQKGPNADNPNAVAFGAEGIDVWPVNTMVLTHNTIVSTYAGGNFIRTHAGIQSLTLTANLLAGSANLLWGLSPDSPVIQQQSNFTTVASSVSGATRLNNPDFWPANDILASLKLATIPDAQYLRDAPAPLTVRTITGSTRQIGALQTVP